jgi:cation diffusion facilitator family transporter
MKIKKLIAILAVVANFVLAVGKIVVGIISKSASIFADGINSSTDVLASTISYIGIKISEKPADKEHPYGHDKAEVLAGLLITLIIFFSGVWIIYNAISSIIYNQETQLSLLSFIVMGSSAFINWGMSSLKLHFGKKYNSLSLITDGIHSRIDLLVSLSIFIGLFFIKYFSFLDEILALLVGIYILRESLSLGKETTDILIGTQADEKIENKIKEVIKKNKINLSELKTQKMGEHIFAQVKV